MCLGAKNGLGTTVPRSATPDRPIAAELTQKQHARARIDGGIIAGQRQPSKGKIHRRGRGGVQSILTADVAVVEDKRDPSSSSGHGRFPVSVDLLGYFETKRHRRAHVPKRRKLDRVGAR